VIYQTASTEKLPRKRTMFQGFSTSERSPLELALATCYCIATNSRELPGSANRGPLVHRCAPVTGRAPEPNYDVIPNWWFLVYKIRDTTSRLRMREARASHADALPRRAAPRDVVARSLRPNWR
jgi:hypothetical protein